MKKLVSKLILYMLGWKAVSHIPTLKKYYHCLRTPAIGISLLADVLDTCLK